MRLFKSPYAQPEAARDRASVSEGRNKLPASGRLDQQLVNSIEYLRGTYLSGSIDYEFDCFVCGWEVPIRGWRGPAEQNGLGLYDRRFGSRRIRCASVGIVGANDDRSVNRIVDRPITFA
jgi:hypothetical protein